MQYGSAACPSGSGRRPFLPEACPDLLFTPAALLFRKTAPQGCIFEPVREKAPLKIFPHESPRILCHAGGIGPAAERSRTRRARPCTAEGRLLTFLLLLPPRRGWRDRRGVHLEALRHRAGK